MSLHALVAVSLALLGAGPEPTTGKAVTHQLLDARVMAGKEIPHGPMSYLVAPSGHVFRLLGTQPILDADGTKLGLLLSYVGDTRDVALAMARGAELVEALRLDMQYGNEDVVLVQARIGFDARTPYNFSIALHDSYVLRDGRWVALPTSPGRKDKKRAGIGPLEVVDDPKFPFDGKELDQAAAVADRLVRAVDAGALDEARQELASSYVAKAVTPDPAQWAREMADVRRMARGAPRRLLYRMLLPSPSSGARLARLMYEVDVGVPGKPALEPVILQREPDRWRVIGFGLKYPNEAVPRPEVP